MPAEIIIANPLRKRTRRRRKMTAKQLKYFGPKRARVTRARRNPIGATIRHRARHYAHRARAHISVKGVAGSFIRGQVLPAGIGAAGALALDVAWPYLPIPASWQGSAFAPLLRVAGAAGIGYAATALMGRQFGREVANGAMIVTLYDIGKEYLANALPPPGASAALPPPATAPGAGVYLPGLGWYSAAQDAGMGVYANA